MLGWPTSRGCEKWEARRFILEPYFQIILTASQTLLHCASYNVDMFGLRGSGAWIVVLLLGATIALGQDCIPVQEANRHVGQSACVTGKVVRVKLVASGLHFLDFCEDQMACPFTVVVFPHDLKDVGDVRRLEGRAIELKGPVKRYAGRAEMILRRIGQITGGAHMIPPLPKEYDVEKTGHYSAGHLHAKKLKTTKAKPNPAATYGNEADVEEPPE